MIPTAAAPRARAAGRGAWRDAWRARFRGLPFARKLHLFLLLAGATLGTILLVTGSVTYRVQGDIERLGNEYYPSIENMWRLQQALRDVQRTLQDAATTADPEALAEADASAEEIRTRLAPALAGGTPDPAHARLLALFEAYYGAARDASAGLAAGETGAPVDAALAALRVRHHALTGAVQAHADDERAELVREFARLRAMQRRAFGAGLAIALAALAALAMLARLATTSLVGPLRHAVDVADRVAAGDLAVALPPAGEDEVGQLLRAMGHMVANLRASERQLVHQATHDALTALPNRAHFHERMRAALARAAARGDASSVAVLALDLDGFKLVNDSAGHAAGDALLVEVADRLLNATRGCDLVARLGGDEFAVLVANVREDADAHVVASRIVAAVAQPYVVDGATMLVTASVGIARGRPVGTIDATDGTAPLAAPEALLRDADLALYAAKARGKGQAVSFEPPMHAAALERVHLEAALREGLGRGELQLAYQPIVELSTGRVVGVEALVRWRHPGRGFVSPATFIPLAEETGLIRPLGRWVLEAACRQGAAWNAAHAGGGASPLTVTVNVSGRQLQDAGFVDEVRRVLAASSFPAAQLVIELTESTLVQQPAVARERLVALKALGVRVALDDFGTGYSALSYLRQFPIDVLKIDKSFVDDVARGGRPTALAAAIVALGEALTLRTVAEGIETAEQAAALERLGCPLGQGYHFSAPVAAREIDALLAAAEARGALALAS